VISHALSPSPDDAFGLRRQETRSGRRGEVVFPAGESSKTLDTLRALYSACLAHSLDRHGTILALGGGVVGDVAGFVAATFMRGVRWVNLPTTILAMADSSLGGKVGVDLPEGKNLVGAFHPPTLILADFDTLATLPAIETRCGLAEIIKSALIADPALFSEINSFYNMNQHPEYSEAQSKDVLPSAPLLPSEARSPAAFPCPPAFVTRAASIKVGFVTSDPFEKAERAKLNLGHTIGHGVESASGYALRHGEAVAIGLVAEARLAETLGLAASGLAEQIATCLQNVGLPTRCVGLDPHAIRAAMSGDKKKSGGQLKFTLPKNIGEVEFGIEVEEQTLSAILEQITHA
jgi:3-dehydroquinate synthase